MPCGHGCQKSGHACGKQDCHRRKDECDHKEAFAQIKLVFSDPNLPLPPNVSGNPYAEVSEYAPHCGVKHAELAKIYRGDGHLFPAECIAFKVKVAYDDCYFACGFVPNLQVTTCAPDEHHYNALVRPLCAISNNQHAFFRVDIFENAECYPTCIRDTIPTAEGVVAFNILATQGDECKY